MTSCFCLKLQYNNIILLQYKIYGLNDNNIYCLYSSIVMLQITWPQNMRLGLFELFLLDTNRSNPLLPTIQPLISAKFWTTSFNNVMRKNDTESLHSSVDTEMIYTNRNILNCSYVFKTLISSYYTLQCLYILRFYHNYDQTLIFL